MADDEPSALRPAPAPAPARRRSGALAAARVAIALLGLAALAFTVHRAGPARIAEIAQAAAPWIPVAIALEALRIFFDALASRYVLGERGRHVPLSTLWLAQFVAHGVMGVFPAGRAASEVAKATPLSAYVPPQVAIAMGASNQANVLTSSALFSLVCALGALAVSPDATLAIALVIHFFVLMAAGVGMRVAATNPHVERFLAARFPRLAERARLFHEASRDTPLLAPAPILAMIAGRVVQTLEYAVLAYAVGVPITIASALAVQGVYFVAAALSVFVPAQLGSQELVFLMSAGALGTTEAAASSIALLGRAPMFLWIAFGLITLSLWRARRASGTA